MWCICTAVVGTCVVLGESYLGLGMHWMGDIAGAMNGRVARVDGSSEDLQQGPPTM